MELWQIALEDKGLYHYGTKHHSGRYPYGSGERPYQDREKRELEDYRRKEIDNIKTRIKKNEKTTTKAEKRLRKRARRERDPISRQDRIDAADWHRQYRLITKAIGEKEIEHLEKMSLSDLEEDMMAKGVQIVERVRESQGKVPIIDILDTVERSTSRRRLGSDAIRDTKLEIQIDEAVRRSGPFYGYKNYDDLSNAYAKTSEGKRLMRAGQGAFENGMEAWAMKQTKEKLTKMYGDEEFKRRRAAADKAGDADYPDQFIFEDIQKDRQEKERERKLSQLRKDADEWNKSGRDPEVGRKSAEKYKAAKKKKK